MTSMLAVKVLECVQTFTHHHLLCCDLSIASFKSLFIIRFWFSYCFCILLLYPGKGSNHCRLSLLCPASSLPGLALALVFALGLAFALGISCFGSFVSFFVFLFFLSFLSDFSLSFFFFFFFSFDLVAAAVFETSFLVWHLFHRFSLLCFFFWISNFRN